jgi:hypothetical protein
MLIDLDHLSDLDLTTVERAMLAALRDRLSAKAPLCAGIPEHAVPARFRRPGDKWNVASAAATPDIL